MLEKGKADRHIFIESLSLSLSLSLFLVSLSICGANPGHVSGAKATECTQWRGRENRHFCYTGHLLEHSIEIERTSFERVDFPTRLLAGVSTAV